MQDELSVVARRNLEYIIWGCASRLVTWSSVTLSPPPEVSLRREEFGGISIFELDRFPCSTKKESLEH